MLLIPDPSLQSLFLGRILLCSPGWTELLRKQDGLRSDYLYLLSAEIKACTTLSPDFFLFINPNVDQLRQQWTMVQQPSTCWSCKGPRFGSCTDITGHNPLQHQFQRIWCPLLVSMDNRHAHGSKIKHRTQNKKYETKRWKGYKIIPYDLLHINHTDYIIHYTH